jgi:pilus assembly protein CpaE
LAPAEAGLWGERQVSAVVHDQAGALPLTLAAIKARFAALERSPTLYSLPSARLRLLARRARVEFAASGAPIFQQGEPGDTMYVVLSGRCELSVRAAPETSVVVALLGPGDVIGEESAVLGEPRAASVRAIEDTELLSIDREAIDATLEPRSEEMAELQRLARQRRAGTSLVASWSEAIGSSEGGRSVAFYSPNGGAGRTTVALNVAAQLARTRPGEAVLVDLSLPFNDVALMSNLVPANCLARLADVPQGQFEDALMSAMLPHPAGFMVLPGAIRAEHAELVTPELVHRAMDALRRSFRFVLFDLAVQLSEVTLTVLEGADKILVLATSELSSLKDFNELRRILLDVLRVPDSKLILALNQRAPSGVIDRAAVERSLGHPLLCEFPFEGTKLAEAVMRGEILSVTEPLGQMARAAAAIAAAIGAEGVAPVPVPAARQEKRKRRKIFGLG